MRAYCPGRVNLIGDHTDYNHGLALPMAIDLGTTVDWEWAQGSAVVVHSDAEPDPAQVHIAVPLDHDVLAAVHPAWARLVAAVVAAVGPPGGGRGKVTTTLPVGAGLSSSAALEVALALALGVQAEGVTLARICQRAEQAATGVPTGIMDQLVVASASAGSALCIDFDDLTTRAVPVPEDLDVVVVHSGQRRLLAQTHYGTRVAECDMAARLLGPLGRLDVDELHRIPDPVLRRRARHVVTECDRVRWFCQALEAGDAVEAGRLMSASHRSLAVDFDVSTPVVDQLVEHLVALPGVLGARLTGAGFGGCVVVLARAGSLEPATLGAAAWKVRASAGAHLIEG